jgi:hypothetical protein
MAPPLRRAFTLTELMGVWPALAGMVLPAATILASTLTAAVLPRRQGMLLTPEALGFFTVAMMLVPRLRLAQARPWAAADAPTVPARGTP